MRKSYAGTLKNLFQWEKLTVLQSTVSAYIVCPLRSSLMPWKSNKGTPLERPFPFSSCEELFFDKIDRNFSLTPPSPPNKWHVMTFT